VKGKKGGHKLKNTKLWYRKPAKDWNSALPIGNGRLGGMVFGRVRREEVQLNEDSVWYGGPVDRNNRDALTYLPQIRHLLFEGRIKEAEELATLALSGTPENQRHYQPLGNLFLDFDHDENNIDNYHRELDINDSMVTVSYSYKGIKYTREYFSSAPDQVIVIKITANKPGRISFRAQLRRGKYVDTIQNVSNDTIMLEGNSGGENGIGFCTMVRA